MNTKIPAVTFIVAGIILFGKIAAGNDREILYR